MTKSQQRTVDRIRESVERRIVQTNERGIVTKEIKRWEVKTSEYGSRTVFLYATVGLVNDEGTYASIFCRDDLHLAIGPRGAVKYFDDKKHKWAKAPAWKQTI